MGRHVGVSAYRLVSGFGLGLVSGAVVGAAIGLSTKVADALEGLVDVTRQISPVAWIPLAILWFGFGEGSKIFIVFLGTFFPVTISVGHGVRALDPKLLWAAQSLGAKGVRLARVVVAAVLPRFFTGAVIGWGTSARFIVAAELAGAQSGVGFLMMSAREAFRGDLVMVGIVVLGTMGAVSVWLLERAARTLTFWEGGLGTEGS